MVGQVLANEAEEVVDKPFMGWPGWPPTSVVVVTVILGLIFEVVFCIGFWQFWTSGDAEEDLAAAAAAASTASNETVNDTLNATLNDTLNATEETAEDPTP